MRPDPMPAPRHHHIDLLKALAILLVVLGHSIQFTQSLYQDCIAFQAIYSFHMHLFFFVSGILASGSALGARLRSRAATLLVPFVAWMPIYWFAERVLRIGPDLGGLTAYILATFAAPSLGLWFLWALFLIHLVHAALQATHRLILATALAIAIFAFLQMQLPNPEIFGLGYVKMYLAYFVLGTVVKAHEPRSAASRCRTCWRSSRPTSQRSCLRAQDSSRPPGTSRQSPPCWAFTASPWRVRSRTGSSAGCQRTPWPSTPCTCWCWKSC